MATTPLAHTRKAAKARQGGFSFRHYSISEMKKTGSGDKNDEVPEVHALSLPEACLLKLGGRLWQ